MSSYSESRYTFSPSVFENTESDESTPAHPRQTSYSSIPASTRTTRQPRLSSPRLFRDFFVTPTSNITSRTLPQGHFRDSVQDVNRALASATQAVQSASQALGPPHPPPFIDLTAESSVSQSPESSPQPRLPPLPDPNRDVRPTTGRNRLIDVVQNIRQRQFTRTANMSHPNSTAPYHQPHYLEPASEFQDLNMPEMRPPTAEEIRREESRAIQRQHNARRVWEQNQRGRNFQRRPKVGRLSRRASSADVKSTSPSSSAQEIESVDLTQIDDDSSLASALSKQRQDAICSQKQKLGSLTGRSSLTSYKCPVCLETPKDATTTVCGHLFCHECIMETLRWSELQRTQEAGKKQHGGCPVCRKPLPRKDGNVAQRSMVPLEIKLMTKKRKRSEKGKERARFESEVQDNPEKETRTTKKERDEARMWDELTVL